MVFCTSWVLPTPFDQETVVFYLKPAGDTLYCRMERELFSIERIFAAGLSPKLERLTKIDRIGNRMFIWGLTKSTTGRPGTKCAALRSVEYPPFPILTPPDLFASRAGFSGSHLPMVVSAGLVGTDPLASAATFSGVYFDCICLVPAFSADTLASAATFGGTYVQIMETADVTGVPDTLGSAVTFYGVYEEIMRPVGPETDAVISAASFSGSYVAA